MKKVTWNGCEFRTVGSQATIQTDNSCILSKYQAQENKNEEKKLKISVGRITDIYVHTLFGKEGRADHKWSVFIKADWYEPVGVSPVNGLLQVQQNDFWDRCGIVNITSCHAINCVFWPSDPFPLLNKQKTKRKQSKHQVTYDVITHHDTEKTITDLSVFFE